MLKTQSTGSDEEKAADINGSGKRVLNSRRSSYDPNSSKTSDDQSYVFNFSGDICNSKSTTSYSEQLMSANGNNCAPVFNRTQEPFNTDSFWLYNERQMRIYRAKLEDDLMDDHRRRRTQRQVNGYCVSNVRRNKRQRKTLYDSISMNENNSIDRNDLKQEEFPFDYREEEIDDAGDYELDLQENEEKVNNFFNTQTRQSRSRHKLRNDNENMMTLSNELKRLGLPQKTASDIENDGNNDMYMRTKSSRRKIISNDDTGVIADTEETEELEMFNSKRLRRRRRLHDSQRNFETSDEEMLNSDEIEINNEQNIETRINNCSRMKRQAFNAQDKKMSIQDTNENHSTTPSTTTNTPAAAATTTSKSHHIGGRRTRARHSYTASKFFLSSHCRRKLTHSHASSTDSSFESSDEEEYERRKVQKPRSRVMSFNLQEKKDHKATTIRDRVKISSSLVDAEPMSIDRTMMFDNIGALDDHINALKEMAIYE